MFSVPLWCFDERNNHHRDAEGTEDAQRKQVVHFPVRPPLGRPKSLRSQALWLCMRGNPRMAAKFSRHFFGGKKELNRSLGQDLSGKVL